MRLFLALALILVALPALGQPAPVPPPRPLGYVDEPGSAAPADPLPGNQDAMPVPPVSTPAEPEPAAEAAPRVYQSACPAVLDGLVAATALPPISEGACGERSPLMLESIAAPGGDIAVSGAPITACGMAGAFALWAQDLDRYARAVLETGLAGIAAGTAYQCRGVNNTTGGRLSEHAFANALDISGFTFEDGRQVSVRDNWRAAPSTPEEKFLAFAHGAACARFTTVLGPEANALHYDHFHLDLGCHGASCTVRLCE